MPLPPPVISTEAPSRSGNRADGIMFVSSPGFSRHGIGEASTEGKTRLRRNLIRIQPAGSDRAILSWIETSET